ncbi:hypothetical protein ABGB17_31045 [Sphaerisporangium sp. B11E5]|uniref:hypothetical protein n=1 Tax=Sphaerisporangium sp. B11E5 TaxID=3153563 RepID=UPI00325E1EB5
MRLARTLVAAGSLLCALIPAAAHGEAGESCADAGKGAARVCFTRPDLLEAYDMVRRLEWHPRAPRSTFAVHPGPDGTRLHVSFGPGDSDVARALKAELGDRVELTQSAVTRFEGGRASDAGPHWGGAEIQVFGNICTSGFSVVLPGGARGSVSAGHCFDDGDGLASGPHFYGVAHGESGFPAYDMIAISGGGAYTNKIYTDPGSPISRTVIGRGDPAMGSSVCVSGRLAKARCGGTVVSLAGALFQGGGWTTDLIVVSKPGQFLGTVGDSGGPVYSQAAGSGAVVRGMIVGGTLIGDTVYAEKVSTIESHLGVTVAVTP